MTDRTFHPPWWVEYPDRLQAELDCLAHHGIRCERDEEAYARRVLRLRLFPVVDGTELLLVATFPDTYPYFSFQVSAPKLNLPYHQHARVKNLCLLPRDTRWWRPASDRLGDFIAERLPNVLEAGSTTEFPLAADAEEHQAEPYSDYYLYQQGSMVLTDSAWRVPSSTTSGIIQIGVPPPAKGEYPPQILNGALLKVLDESEAVVAEASPELSKLYPHILKGRWVRLDSPIPADLAPEEIFQRADAMDLYPDRLKAQPVSDGGMRIRGVLFPEEREWRGIGKRIMGDAWLFAVQLSPSLYSAKKRGKQKVKSSARSFYLARSARSGQVDFSARIPELSVLSEHCVAVFGLGCIGAPSVIELARAGVGELHILDRDYVDPATTVRWPLGLSAAGADKDQALGVFLARNYPRTKVVGAHWQIGFPRNDVSIMDGSLEQDLFLELLDNASVIYDATAEYGVQHYLADLASEHRITYIGVQTTPGGWGGLVLRIRPGVTEGCWSCLQLALTDGTIPTPSWDEVAGNIQPTGCANPTFTGANFDTMEVALMGVRATVATLCAGRESAYPPMDWEVAVLRLRDQAGNLIMPEWKGFQLRRHPLCQAHHVTLL